MKTKQISGNILLKNGQSNKRTDILILLLSRCQEIANNPELGKTYDGITNDLLGLRTEKHIIFYRKRINKPIEITRILHGRMDLKNRIG